MLVLVPYSVNSKKEYLALSPLITTIHVFSHNKANNPNTPDRGKVPVSNKQRIPFWNLLKFQVLLCYIIYSSLPFLFRDIGVHISAEDTFIHKKTERILNKVPENHIGYKSSMLPFRYTLQGKLRTTYHSSLIWQ